MLSSKNWHFINAKLQDPFKILKKDNISENSQLRNNAASAYKFFLVMGIIGLVVTLIISGLRLAFSKDASKKSEVKSGLGNKTVAALIFFSFVSLIGIVYGLIVNLV